MSPIIRLIISVFAPNIISNLTKIKTIIADYKVATASKKPDEIANVSADALRCIADIIDPD